MIIWKYKSWCFRRHTSSPMVWQTLLDMNTLSTIWRWNCNFEIISRVTSSWPWSFYNYSTPVFQIGRSFVSQFQEFLCHKPISPWNLKSTRTEAEIKRKHQRIVSKMKTKKSSTNVCPKLYIRQMLLCHYVLIARAHYVYFGKDLEELPRISFSMHPKYLMCTSSYVSIYLKNMQCTHLMSQIKNRYHKTNITGWNHQILYTKRYNLIVLSNLQDSSFLDTGQPPPLPGLFKVTIERQLWCWEWQWC